MKRLLRPLGAVVVALAVAVAGCPAVGAHGGEDALVLQPPVTTPGGVVGVRGDLPTTNSIRLVLVGVGQGDQGEVTLARLEDPPQGHFETAVTVPTTAAPGTWHVEAQTAGGAVLAESELTVLAASPSAARDDRAEPVALSPGSTARALSAIRPDIAAPATRERAPTVWWPYAVVAAMLLAAVGWVRRHRRREHGRVPPAATSSR
ncbi:MAG TPA: hypothetical protein VFL38_17560 [Humibacillus xanthopallidus]|nr:hypothetical protein [Humibacillus xanthopallidus]